MDAYRIQTEFNSLTSLGITRGNIAKINNGRGVLVRVELGKVWLTQDGETRDVYLNAGESFRIERDGLTLVSTCGTPFAMVTLAPSIPVAPSLGERLAGAFWKVWAGLYAMPSRPATTRL